MKKYFRALLSLVVSVSVISCSDNVKDDLAKNQITPPTQAELVHLREKSLESLVVKKTFDASAGISFTSDKGVEFNFTGTLLDKDGNVVTGNVDLEYIEIFDRGNMLATNKPLMGYDTSENLRPLVTGGEFYVNMTQNGEQLSTYYSYSLKIPASLTGEFNQDMKFWAGEIDDNDDLFWGQFNLGEGQKENAVWGDRELNQYNLISGHFGWTNVDILAGEDGEKTPLLVKVPEGYTNKNASVYVAYLGKPGMLAFLDVYDPTEKIFTEHYGWAPIGYSLYVIFVSEYQEKYVYCIKELTVEKNKFITIDKDELLTCTKEEIITKINALP